MSQTSDPTRRAAALPCWSGPVVPEPLSGGITNVNFEDDRPDGRSRRSTLKRKHLEPPRYQQIADRVKRMLEGEMLIEEVAQTLGLTPPAASMRYLRAIRRLRDLLGEAANDD